MENKYSAEKIKKNINNLKKEKSMRETCGHKAILDKDIAKKLNISPSAYCKRLSGEYPFYADELVKIADFFGVSCDEVITGKPPEITAVYDSTPLDKASISFINKLNYELPDCIELLNIILNNNDKNHLGERLLKTILYYCYGDIFKISSVSDSTPLNADSSIRILKLLALDDLSYLLDDIAKEWERKMESPDTALEKAMREKDAEQAPSPETRRRLRIKAKSNLKMKKNKVSTVKLINLVEDLDNNKEEYAKLPKREREQTSPAEMYETLLDSRQALAENWSSIQTELSKEEIGVFEKVIHKLIDIYGTSEEQEIFADDNNGFPTFEF